MQPNDPNTKRKIIAGAAIAALLIIAAILFFLPGKDSDTYDPATDPSLSASKALTYDGFGELSDHGFTSIQMDGLKYALHQSDKSSSSFKVDTSTITDSPYNPDNPTDTVQTSFTITINGKKYKAIVDKYTDLINVALTLEDQNKVTTYTSGAIDSTKVDLTDSQNLGD